MQNTHVRHRIFVQSVPSCARWVRIFSLLISFWQHIPPVSWIRYIFKFFKYLHKISNRKIVCVNPFPLFIIWPLYVTYIQRGSWSITWSSPIIPWYWRCGFPLVQATNLQRNFQGSVLITVLHFLVFPHISESTTSHVHRCILLFPERIPNESTIIIYGADKTTGKFIVLATTKTVKMNFEILILSYLQYLYMVFLVLFYMFSEQLSEQFSMFNSTVQNHWTFQTYWFKSV